jgi:hypothetical protein
MKWNVEVEDPVTILRLISELEGCSYILSEVDEDDYETIGVLIRKYYKRYYQMKKALV